MSTATKADSRYDRDSIIMHEKKVGSCALCSERLEGERKSRVVPKKSFIWASNEKLTVSETSFKFEEEKKRAVAQKLSATEIYT